jgi:RNA polymerase sigma-70 factor (ECF subfamily)
MQRLRLDDDKALSYLFAKYYNVLFRAGIKTSQDHHLTEECIQEVFQDLWNYRKSISEIISFEAYLRSSLKNKISKKAIRKVGFKEENIDNYIFSVASYEQILIEQETTELQKSILKEALEELTPRQKEIIILKYFEELSYKEISDKTGLQVDSIYKTLHEGIKKLKNILTFKR